jgi:hypothetical protein
MIRKKQIIIIKIRTKFNIKIKWNLMIRDEIVEKNQSKKQKKTIIKRIKTK